MLLNIQAVNVLGMWLSVVTLINDNLRTWNCENGSSTPVKEFSMKQISLAQSSLEIAPNTQMRKRNISAR
ncbi:MAG: hypothetical protein ORN21_05210 [Methylophilaceae bacterium]|nr:hypothetical protein [Methylophilaceae bacterium]